MAKKKQDTKKNKKTAASSQKKENPWESFLTAVYSDDMDSIKTITANGFDLNGHNEYGYFPLYFAVRNLEMMKCVVSLGAYVNAVVKNTTQHEGITCLMNLASSDEKSKLREKMEFLVQAGANVNAQDAAGRTSLHHAIQEEEGNPEAVEILLSLKADPNISDVDGYTPLVHAEGRQVLISGWQKETSMPKNLKKICKMLLAAGAKSSNTDFLYLYKAVRDRELEKVRSLIQQGVDVNHVWGVETCLAEACYHGDAAIVEMFLDAGADPNLIKKGQHSPLIEAASKGHFEIVKRLLAAGADVGYECLGINAEKYACEGCHTDVADYLRQCALKCGKPCEQFGQGRGVISYELNEAALVIKAGIDTVSKIFKEFLGASVYQKDVQRKKVTVTEECYCLMQFAGRQWTNIYEIKSRSKSGLSKELGEKISGKTNALVLFYQNSDTAGAVEYFLFEKGIVIESVEMDPEGWGRKKKAGKQKGNGITVISRSGEIAAEDIKNGYDFINERIKKLGVLIPGFGYSMAPTGSQVCFFESMAKEDFVRVDFVAL